MTARQKTLFVSVLLVGILLRFWGLSHDLHEGNVYHPDTPKQVRAVERFLGGSYYIHTGIPDYDDYPYLNPHIVEYLIRAERRVEAAVLGVLGVPPERPAPDYFTIFWITRILNATLSSLLILVAFQIGRENFGLRVGLVGALLLALSPADILACHFAGADTTAAFFATLTVLFAFRIYREGRHRDYLLAGICAACGYAAKYHAGMAILPVVVAHTLRLGGVRALFSGTSMRRLLLLTVVGIATAFIAIPPLCLHFSDTIRGMIRFFLQISRYKGPPEDVLRYGVVVAKTLFAMKRNLPILWTILGPLVCVGVVVELASLYRRDHRKLILFSMPLLYFFVGVVLRPLAHPLYHSLATPLIFIAAALFFTGLPQRAGKRRRLVAVACALAIAISAAYLGRCSIRECFFFWHQDTSRMAAAWTDENLPTTFGLIRGSYTFDPKGQYSLSEKDAAGLVLARSNSDSTSQPANFAPWKSFALENLSLAVFRNHTIDLSLGPTPLIRPDFKLPVFQPVASQTGNQFVFDNGPRFFRDEKLLLLQPGRDVVRWIAASEPLKEAWVCVQNGELPTRLALSCAGTDIQWQLEPRAVKWFTVSHPRAGFPSTPNRPFYRFHAANNGCGSARMLIATRADEIGAMLYNLGSYKDAYPLLVAGARARRNPTIAAEAVISAKLAGAVPAQDVADLARNIEKVVDADSLHRVYGISAEYLDALDYLSFEAQNLVPDEFDQAEEPSNAIPEAVSRVGFANRCRSSSAWTSSFVLDPGYYTVTLRLHPVTPQAGTTRMAVQLADAAGGIHFRKELDSVVLDPPNVRTDRVSVLVPRDLFTSRLVVSFQGTCSNAVEISIAPDPVRSLAALHRVLQLCADGEAGAAADEPLAYEPSLRLGDAAARAGRFQEAFRHYSAAAALQPEAAAPLLGLLAIRDKLPAATMAPLAAEIEGVRAAMSRHVIHPSLTLQKGIRLTSAGLKADSVKRGLPLDVSFGWRLNDPHVPVDRYSVFVHFVDASRKIAFQGDHAFRTALLMQVPEGSPPAYLSVPVPLNVKPGVYGVIVGVLDIDNDKRLKVLSTDLPKRHDSVTLPLTVTVTP